MAKLVLFDLDGVLLSEDAYLYAAAAAAGEFVSLLYPHIDFKRPSESSSLDDFRLLREWFLPPVLLCALRRRAINSNWDKAYAVVVLAGCESAAKTHGFAVERFGASAMERLQTMTESGQALMAAFRGRERGAAAPAGQLFSAVQAAFQRWYLGDEHASTECARLGTSAFETLLAERDVLLGWLNNLRARGAILGVGTGRPRAEAQKALSRFGLWSVFAPDRICTIDEVRRAEEGAGVAPFALAKPHPYTYQLSAAGFSPEDVYVIGDSVSDAIAAGRAGFHFVGVGDAQDFAGASVEPCAIVKNVTELQPGSLSL
ncbi:MAG: HAD family hydrolase [Bacilli bacterium]